MKPRVQLTKKQSEAYEVVKWLMDDSRRQGKTYLMCVILLEKAIKSGSRVPLVDHYTGSTDNLQYMLRMLRDIYGESGLIDYYQLEEYKHGTHYVAIKLTRKCDPTLDGSFVYFDI